MRDQDRLSSAHYRADTADYSRLGRAELKADKANRDLAYLTNTMPNSGQLPLRRIIVQKRRGDELRTSSLGAIALGVGGAAAIGFGAAAGRDLWKSTKKAGGFLLFMACVLGAVCLPYMGGRNMLRGHAPGEGGKIILDILMIVAGAAFGVGATIVIGLFTSAESGGAAAVLLIVGAVGALVAGMIVGATQRPGAQRRIKIAYRNEQFLSDMGFIETGESEITHYDGDGNGLRFMERSKDSIVFIAVGKRNKRAYIGLSPNGEMTGYTGVIVTGAPRVFLPAEPAA